MLFQRHAWLSLLGLTLAYIALMMAVCSGAKIANRSSSRKRRWQRTGLKAKVMAAYTQAGC